MRQYSAWDATREALVVALAIISALAAVITALRAERVAIEAVAFEYLIPRCEAAYDAAFTYLEAERLYITSNQNEDALANRDAAFSGHIMAHIEASNIMARYSSPETVLLAMDEVRNTGIEFASLYAETSRVDLSHLDSLTIAFTDAVGRFNALCAEGYGGLGATTFFERYRPAAESE